MQIFLLYQASHPHRKQIKPRNIVTERLPDTIVNTIESFLLQQMQQKSQVIHLAPLLLYLPQKKQNL